ncbi:MAG TPA: ABC transporter ATP-binding protein [Streptosporangiaceae bacterium]
MTSDRVVHDAAASSAAMTGDQALLDVRDLQTRYPVRRSISDRLARRPRQWVRAVDGVSFSLRRGEMVALVGESGCGKTSTAQTILRMTEAAGGSITVDGQDITSVSQRKLRPLRRGIQMVYQDPYESLDPRFRVRQTVAEPLLVHGIGGSSSERAALVTEALERAGLSPASLYLDRYPHELSGGQRQRVAIAAALALDPMLLLADEPVSMLDVSVRAGVLALLDGLRRDGRLGVLMITHDLSTAARFADRIAVMYLGRIVEYGPAREVVADPRHPYTKALLSVVPNRDPRVRGTAQILSGETPNPVAIPSGCRFRPRCPIAEDRCAQTDPQLALSGNHPQHQAACLLASLAGGGAAAVWSANQASRGAAARRRGIPAPRHAPRRPRARGTRSASGA